MVIGTVINNKQTKFYDGEFGNKLLIILGQDKNKNLFLCCKVTSKIQFNINNIGCHFKYNIYLTNSQPFNKDTWIQFDNFSLFEYSSQYLLNGHFSGYINEIGEIKENDFRSIINCIKKSEDISKYHLSLLNRKS